jgi:hypothetical protein
VGFAGLFRWLPWLVRGRKFRMSPLMFVLLSSMMLRFALSDCSPTPKLSFSSLVFRNPDGYSAAELKLPEINLFLKY